MRNSMDFLGELFERSIICNSPRFCVKMTASYQNTVYATGRVREAKMDTRISFKCAVWNLLYINVET